MYCAYAQRGILQEIPLWGVGNLVLIDADNWRQWMKSLYENSHEIHPSRRASPGGTDEINLICSYYSCLSIKCKGSLLFFAPADQF